MLETEKAATVQREDVRQLITDTYSELVIVRETLRVEELDDSRSWRWLHP